MPIISAACHHVIFFAIARKVTSCIFIAMCYLDRTYHVLLTCDSFC